MSYDYTAATAGADIFLSLLRRADQTGLAEKLAEAVRVAATADQIKAALDRDVAKLQSEIANAKVELEKLAAAAGMAAEDGRKYKTEADKARADMHAAQSAYEGFLKSLPGAR